MSIALNTTTNRPAVRAVTPARRVPTLTSARPVPVETLLTARPVLPCPFDGCRYFGTDLRNHLAEEHGMSAGAAHAKARDVEPLDDDATRFSARIAEWAEANGWQEWAEIGWLTPEVDLHTDAGTARQAILGQMQDRSPGAFEALVADFGEAVWAAIDGEVLAA
jgi:hypothetical protein